MCFGKGEVEHSEPFEDPPGTPPDEMKFFTFTKVKCPLCVEKNLQPFIEIDY